MSLNRIPQPDDQTLQALVSLKGSFQYQKLAALLISANNSISKSLRSIVKDELFHVEQGAGQMLDEILELIDNSEEILKNRKVAKAYKPKTI